MKNKKAILMPETLKIIIAVISISLLAYLAVNLYGIFTQNQQSEKVHIFTDELQNKINFLCDGNTTELMILGLEGWVIT